MSTDVHIFPADGFSIELQPQGGGGGGGLATYPL